MNRTRLKEKRRHVRQRFMERHGLEVTAADLKVIAQKIQAGNGRFVKRKSNRAVEWEVEFAGERRRVIYDKKHNIVVTVLPPRTVVGGEETP